MSFSSSICSLLTQSIDSSVFLCEGRTRNQQPVPGGDHTNHPTNSDINGVSDGPSNGANNGARIGFNG